MAAKADWSGLYAILSGAQIDPTVLWGAIARAHAFLESAVRDAGIDKRAYPSFHRACEAAAARRGVRLPVALTGAVALRNRLAHQTGNPKPADVREAVRVYELAWCALTGETAVDPRASEPPPASDAFRLGPWQPLAALGKGGMGEVLRCKNVETGELAAVKILIAEHVHNENAQNRFRRERNVTRQLNREYGAPAGLIRYFGADVEDERVTPEWIALELVDGQTLGEVLQAHRLPDGRPLRDNADRHALAIHVGEAVAEVCQWAHDHSVAHRDLKPDNLMLTPTGRVVVLDFGIARDAQDSRITEVDGGAPHTEAYAPPEVLHGQRVPDFKLPAGDVYSLGMVLFEILVGRVHSRSPHDLAALPPGALSAEVRAMLAADPDQRPPMKRVIAALAAAHHGAHRGRGDTIPESPHVASASPTITPERRATTTRPPPPKPTRPPPAPPVPTDPAPPSASSYAPWAALALLLTAGVAWSLLPDPPGSCGDGQLDPGEACDDGNLFDGDNCSAACLPATYHNATPAPLQGQTPPPIRPQPSPPAPPPTQPPGGRVRATPTPTPRSVPDPRPTPTPTPPPTPAPAATPAAPAFPPATPDAFKAYVRDTDRDGFEKLLRAIESDRGYLRTLGAAATKEMLSQSMQRFGRAISPSEGASDAVIDLLPSDTLGCRDAKIWLSWTYDDIDRSPKARTFYDRHCAKCRAERPDLPNLSERECTNTTDYKYRNGRCVHRDNEFYTQECTP